MPLCPFLENSTLASGVHKLKMQGDFKQNIFYLIPIKNSRSEFLSQKSPSSAKTEMQ